MSNIADFLVYFMKVSGILPKSVEIYCTVIYQVIKRYRLGRGPRSTVKPVDRGHGPG